jgi:hypothetical protein
MASLGYAAIAQTRAAASGNDFMLATFYKASKLRLAWGEERSRALLAAFEVVEQGPAHGQVCARAVPLALLGCFVHQRRLACLFCQQGIVGQVRAGATC